MTHIFKNLLLTCFEKCKFGVDAEKEEHEEEEKGPKWSDGKKAHCFRISDEGQTLSGLDNIFEVFNFQLKLELTLI